MLVQELLGALVGDARRHRDELLRHQRVDGLIEVLLEADVARREDADERLAVDDGDAADVVLVHHRERLAQRLRRAHGDGRGDHPALGALDALDLAGLLRGRHVLVQDPDPAGAGDGDRRAPFGHRVHRRAQQRDVELDPLREAGLDVDLTGEDLAVRRDEEDIVERQAFAEFVVEHGQL